jgi:hypothetical protein
MSMISLSSMATPMNKHLATTDEIKEINVAMQDRVKYVPTFIMMDIQYYRIIAPLGHPHFGSDMSIQGMREWSIIPDGGETAKNGV